ncbi:MAG: (2Fe-2S)-binding protein [Deltaproteobacteria bacterium]|nr:(2Fe-2S)-binding protein [Deltaproteobacteria bacterium]
MSEKKERKNKLRINTHPVSGLSRENRRIIKIFVNNQTLEAMEGETLAAALWANGLIAVGQDPGAELPRGMYCGIGHCYECRVTLDGIEDVRSCLITVREGMQVVLRDHKHIKDNQHDA